MTHRNSNSWSKGKNLLSPEIANSKTFKVINILSVLALLINTSVAALAVIPNKATAATIPLLTETFESFSAGSSVGSPWSQQNGVRVENKDGDKAAELDAGDGDEEAFWTSFNTTGYETIKLSYDRKTEGFENGDHLYAEWRLGSGSWTSLENVSSNSGWTSKSYTLASSANNTTNVQIRFRIDGNHESDKAWVDNVKVEGDEIQAPSNVTNPVLGQSCGLDIALVIDSSGSISDTELTQLKDAYKGFVDAFLPGTPTQFSVTEFDDTATVKDVDSAAGFQQFGNQISGIKGAINSANSGGYTNWEDGLVKGWSTFDPRPIKQNLLIFASDGNPNKKGADGQVVAESLAVAAAVTQANTIKAAGTRIVALGIGNDLDINNLKAISGPNVAPPSAINANADVITANFSTLGTTLSALANQLCGGKILVQKQFDTNSDGQVDVDGNTPNAVLAGWTFDVNGSPTNPEPQTTTNTGSLEFSVQNGSHYSISETNQLPGTSLASAVCMKNQQPVNSADFAINTDETVTCTFVNKTDMYRLRVKKDVDTDGDGHVNIYHATGWTWDIANGAQNNPTVNGDVWVTLPAGSYTISEDQKPGYKVENLTCVEHANNNFEHGYGAVESATINLTNGDQTCIFTNSATKGTLIVKKVVSGSNAAPSEWMLHVQKDNQEVAGSPAAGSTTGTSYSLMSGTYNVSETGGPAGYTASFSESCPNGVATVTPGQTTTCTITNTRDTGSIKVNKQVDADANGSFEGGNTQANTLGFDWGLDGVTPNRDMGTTVSPVTTGDHTVTENSVANYHFVGWYPTGNTQYSCANPKGTTLPISLSVVKGQTNEITLCNVRDTGRITFDKVVVGGNAKDSDFTFRVNNTNYKDGNAATFLTGSYAVTETGPNGYTLTNATGACSLNQQNQITLNVTSQGGTCVITNTRDTGTIIVHKDVKNPDGGQVSDAHTFFVKLNGADQKAIAEGTDATYANLETGTYTITENSDGDYTWYSWSTDANNNQSGAQVLVTKGQTTHLTVVNKQKKAEIKIRKDVRDAQGANISDNTSFSVAWEGQSFTIRENDSETLHVNPGTYTFTEGVNPNYTIHSTNPKSITVGSDEEKEYTFENWKKAPLTIVASKIVCENESDLPDWGRTNPVAANISATTATDYVASHEGCSLVPDWSFQWGDENASNPGDNTGATGNGHWHTFGPTNASGVATVQIADVGSNDNFWMREVMKSDYIPFDGAVSTSSKKVSAEIYCASDVLNFDNYDRIDNPVLGETYHCVAFNVRKTGDIEGSKFNDLNGNGTWNEGEPGLANWTITLSQNDTVIGTTVTDANGHYSFADLPTGTYTVSEEMQNGWTNTTTNPVHNVSVAYNEKTSVNFGNYKYGIITGYKYEDVNHDGKWSENEKGLAGWKICLTPTNQDLRQIASDEIAVESENCVLTNEDGSYQFTNVLAGTYTLSEELKTGWVQYAPGGNGTYTIVVMSGYNNNEQELSLDFGNAEKVSLTLAKWNNQQLAGEGNPFTGGDGILQTSETISYRIDWSVSGNSIATHVVLTDVIPAELNLNVASISNSGVWDAATRTITWDFGTQQPNASGFVTYTAVLITPIQDGVTIVNTAKLSAENSDPTFLTVSSIVKVASNPVLTIDKTVDVQIANPGNTIKYTVAIQNTGTDTAHNVTLSDTLPAGFLFKDTLTPSKVFALGDLASGASTSVSYEVLVGANVVAGFYDNLASAQADNHAAVKDSARVEVRVPQVRGETTPTLSLVKTVDVSVVNPKDTVTYTVTIQNTSTTDATNVKLTDTLPDGFTFTDGTSAKTWELGTLAAGATKTMTYKVNVSKDATSGVYENLAVVTADGTAPVEARAQVQVKVPKVLGATVPETGAGMNDILLFAGSLLLIAVGILFVRRGRELA